MPKAEDTKSGEFDLGTSAGRVSWLLFHVWASNMRRMAEDLGLNHTALSKIASGQRGVGSRVLAAIAAHPKINPAWMLTGVGTPLLATSREQSVLGCSVPVARVLLPGAPTDHPALMTGTSYPVAEPIYRLTRYFYRVRTDDPIIFVTAEKIASGDLLLLDTDVGIWRANRRSLADALVVLHVRGRGGLDYALARIGSDATTGRLTTHAYGLDDAPATSLVAEESEVPIMFGDVRTGRCIEIIDTPTGSPSTGDVGGHTRPKPGQEPKAPRKEARRVAGQQADRSDVPGVLDIKDVVAIKIMLIRD